MKRVAKQIIVSVALFLAFGFSSVHAAIEVAINSSDQMAFCHSQADASVSAGEPQFVDSDQPCSGAPLGHCDDSQCCRHVCCRSMNVPTQGVATHEVPLRLPPFDVVVSQSFVPSNCTKSLFRPPILVS